jgi:hypothetical protein
MLNTVIESAMPVAINLLSHHYQLSQHSAFGNLSNQTRRKQPTAIIVTPVNGADMKPVLRTRTALFWVITQ